MVKLPRISGIDMVRFLQTQGFVLRRIRGSHHVMQRGTQHSTIPVHGNQALRIGTLRSILRDIDLSPREFEKLWR